MAADLHASEENEGSERASFGVLVARGFKEMLVPWVLATAGLAWGLEQPHIVVLLADNVGWSAVGFHKPAELPWSDVHTPHLDVLAATGVELERHYTYKFCSPSRSSFLSGRLPFHSNTYNDDPTMPGAGVPVGMTLLPQVLKQAGYATHQVGKWHVGMASKSTQTPLARGFDSSLFYFHSEVNYYTSVRGQGCGVAVDLYDGTGPSTENGTYVESVFCDRAVSIVEDHGDGPLFLYYAFHTSCVGYNATTGDANLQPEPSWEARFSNIDDPDRRKNVAMVALMDDCVGRIVRSLQVEGLWDSTLLLWSSDNGGAVHLGGGSNVYPLRGGYYNNWEGGIRAPALLNGGFVRRNCPTRKLAGVIHEVDWYATFARLAGLGDVNDTAAAAEGLPPVESLDVWPLIDGTVDASPRTHWPMTSLTENFGDERTGSVGGDAAYMRYPYKLIVGDIIAQAGWTGPVHPNISQPWDSFADTINCSWSPPDSKFGCLFDVVSDPTEHVDLAPSRPDLARDLYADLLDAETRFYDPDRGQPDIRGCLLANQSGWWQPFLP